MTIVLAMSFAVAAPIATFQNASTRFPSRLDTYFKKTVGLTAEEQQQLASGQPVTKLLAGDESKEVAVFGAVWINAPIRRYADAVRDIENFERGGGFKVTKRITTPPQLERFRAIGPAGR